MAASAALSCALSFAALSSRAMVSRTSSGGAPGTTSLAVTRKSLASAVRSSLMSSGPGMPWARRVLARMSVPTDPGRTTATRTWGALVRRSSMSASLNPRTANFAVL